MRNFKQLKIWNKGFEIAVKSFKFVQSFPKEEKFGLASQLTRCAVSVPSNIAEGHTREHLKEYLHHLSMAQASLAEVETQLEIGVRLDYISRDQFSKVLSEISGLGKQLYALRNALIRV